MSDNRTSPVPGVKSPPSQVAPLPSLSSNCVSVLPVTIVPEKVSRLS